MKLLHKALDELVAVRDELMQLSGQLSTHHQARLDSAVTAVVDAATAPTPVADELPPVIEPTKPTDKGKSADKSTSSDSARPTPTPEVKSRIEQQAQQWLFEPYLKNGERVNVRLDTTVRINVIKPR